MISLSSQTRKLRVNAIEPAELVVVVPRAIVVIASRKIREKGGQRYVKKHSGAAGIGAITDARASAGTRGYAIVFRAGRNNKPRSMFTCLCARYRCRFAAKAIPWLRYDGARDRYEPSGVSPGGCCCKRYCNNGGASGKVYPPPCNR